MSGHAKPTAVTMITTMLYREADAAVEWLCRTFDFHPYAVYRGDDGKVIHAELTFGNGMCTHSVYVIVGDIDVHHAHAVAEGADIVMPLREVGEGGRSYSVRDPEGHAWSFGTYDPWQ